MEFLIKQTGVMTVSTTGKLQKARKFSATAEAAGEADGSLELLLSGPAACLLRIHFPRFCKLQSWFPPEEATSYRQAVWFEGPARSSSTGAT